MMPPKHVFHIHDGVVDHHADGDGEATESHGVYGDVEGPKHQQRNGKTHGHGHERDEGRAEVEQEEKQHHHDHDGPITNGLGEVADGVIDKVLLLEKLEGFDAGGQAGVEFGEGGGDLRGESPGIETG